MEVSIYFSNALYRRIPWAVKLLSCQCHGSSPITSQRWFMWRLGTVRQQAITWSTVDPDLCHDVTLLGGWSMCHSHVHSCPSFLFSDEWWVYSRFFKIVSTIIRMEALSTFCNIIAIWESHHRYHNYVVSVGEWLCLPLEISHKMLFRKFPNI